MPRIALLDQYLSHSVAEDRLQRSRLETFDGHQPRTQFLVSSYVSDLPKVEYMLSVERGAFKASLCHRCFIPRHGKATTPCSTRRTKQETTKVLTTYFESNILAQTSQQRSIYPIPPVRYEFLLVAIHDCVDMDCIFRGEKVHFFSYALPILLKEFMSSILNHETRTTRSMVTKRGAKRTSKSVQKTVFRGASQFSALLQRSLMGYSLHTDLFKEGRFDELDGLFPDYSLVCMIEAKYRSRIDIIRPFRAEMMDRCRNLNDGHLDRVFVRHVELHHWFLRYVEAAGCIQTFSGGEQKWNH